MFKKDSFTARPWVFKFLMNIRPPFRCTGTRVGEVSADYRKILVTLPLKGWSASGTHSSGNLYAMCEPFHMVMLQWNLGDDYTVEDLGGAIEHIMPPKGPVSATITLTGSQLDHIRRQTEDSDPYRPGFFVEIIDHNLETVARVTRTLLIKRTLKLPDRSLDDSERNLR